MPAPAVMSLALLLAADGGAAADAAAGRSLPFSLGPAPGSAAPTTQFPLEPRPGGGYRYHRSFYSADIAPDGEVSFADRKSTPGAVVRWLPVYPLPHAPGTVTLQGKLQELATGKRKPVTPSTPPPPTRPQPAAPIYHRDPGGRPLDYPYPMIPVVLVGFQADLLGQYLGLLSEQSAREDKARFLTATFDMRAEMAARTRAARLRGSREQMRKQLALVWSERARPAIERRRLICALWAEVDPTTPAGTEARASVQAFVAERLPAGSPQAFSPVELAACPPASDGTRFAPHR
jgi:hypothetical protein